MSILSDLNRNYLFALFSVYLVGAWHHGYHMTILNIPHEIFKNWTDQVSESNATGTMWSSISAMFPYGCVLGSLFTNIKFSPKDVLVYVSIVTIAGQSLMNMSKEIGHYELLQSGRFIVGVSAGVCSGMAPNFIWDISPKTWRRRMVLMFQFFITFSMFMAQLLGFLLTGDCWIMVVVIATVPTSIGVMCLKFCPESAKYVFITRQNEEAVFSRLTFYRCKSDVNIEFDELNEEQKIMKLEPEVTCRNVWRKNLLISFLVVMAEQLCGSSVFIYHSSTIFREFGMAGDLPCYATLGFSAAILVGTIIAVVAIEYVRPKVLLLVSSGVICVCTALLATFQLLNISAPQQWTLDASVVAFVIYGFAYGLGIAPIRWLIVVESYSYWGRCLVAGLILPWTFGISSVLVHTFLMLTVNVRCYFFIGFACFDLLFFVVVLLVMV